MSGQIFRVHQGDHSIFSSPDPCGTPFTRGIRQGRRAFAIKAVGFSEAIARSRRSARTDMGLLGYTLMRARSEDLVVVLYLSKILFVVRERGHGRDRLVGECYMDGIMRGEGIGFAKYEN